MANVFGTIGEQIGIKASSINLDSIFSFMGQLVTGLIVIILVAGLVGFFLYRRGQKKLYNKQAQFWEDVEGTPKETDLFKMAEITVPNTGMRVFYIKELDLYIPRSTRKVGFRKYWYYIRRNREIINVAPKNLDKEMKELDLDYDHTDMRYANENLKELIDRSFRQKSLKWWLEYKEVISMILIIIAFTFSSFFLLGKMGDLLGQLGGLVEQMGTLTETMDSLLQQSQQINQGSGIIQTA